jgi:hypothetical protein
MSGQTRQTLGKGKALLHKQAPKRVLLASFTAFTPLFALFGTHFSLTGSALPL